MIENYEAVREAIARFMGWQWLGRGWRHPSGLICESPDPLNNPADAWALQCAIVEKGADVVMRRNSCLLECSEWEKEAVLCETPAEALVRAWQAAFGGEV